jgi:hypothetical protein
MSVVHWHDVQYLITPKSLQPSIWTHNSRLRLSLRSMCPDSQVLHAWRLLALSTVIAVIPALPHHASPRAKCQGFILYRCGILHVVDTSKHRAGPPHHLNWNAPREIAAVEPAGYRALAGAWRQAGGARAAHDAAHRAAHAPVFHRSHPLASKARAATGAGGRARAAAGAAEGCDELAAWRLAH